MLTKTLQAHAKWLDDSTTGKRADLSGADLSGARLSDADLSGADLTRTRLSGANLSYADLSYADLTRTRLSGANLSGADLSYAKLSGADLTRTRLWKTNVANTCLDPNNQPNGDIAGFERCGRYVVGYRSRQAGHIDKYRDGRTYTADWFSIADTECHPGLYIWPTIEASLAWIDGYHIRVYVLPEDVHRAGAKWRCRMFKVVGSA
jgi:hypothetical protein